MAEKILKSFLVRQQSSYTSTNNSCTLVQVTLNSNIMVHNMTNISAKSGYGLINAEALPGGDTTLAHSNYSHKSRHY